jgi:hypothetical protein
MKTYLNAALLSVCVGWGAQAGAAGFLFDCTITKKGQGVQWLSDTLAFVVPGDGTIQVIDAVTLFFGISPVKVKVARNSDTKLVMHWKLKGVEDANGLKVPVFDYTARINKTTMAITLEARPRDFQKSWIGRGTCTKLTK